MQIKQSEYNDKVNHEFKELIYPEDPYIRFQPGSMGGKVIDDGESILAVAQHGEDGLQKLLSYNVHDLSYFTVK